METTVNQRIIVLKEHLNLNNLEFCTRVNISVGTMSNIQNDGNVSPKVIRSISESLNVNRDWLLTGKGKMLSDMPKEVTTANPWKDALIAELKEEVTYYRELLKMMAGGGQTAKLKATDAVNMLMFPSQKQLRVGANA